MRYLLLIFICVNGFISLGFAQDNTVQKSLLKLSKELEQKNISSKVVTQNIKSVRTPLQTKEKTKAQASEPVVDDMALDVDDAISTNNKEELEEFPDPFDDSVLQEIFPTENILEDDPSGPWLDLGISLNHLPLSSARINPANTISSWLALNVRMGSFNISYGLSSYDENNLGDSGVAFYQSDTSSNYFLGSFAFELKETTELIVGYLQIETTGDYMYTAVDSSTMTGFFVGLNHHLAESLTVHCLWIPILSHEYSLTISDEYPSSYTPETDDFDTTQNNAVMFGLTYNFFTF